MLGKLFVEDIERLDFTSVEALKASGANKTKTLIFAKLFVEDIERLDFTSVEALKASGANKTKTLIFAVIPQILPSFYRLCYIALN